MPKSLHGWLHYSAPKVRETLGEALERVRQDIERLPWLRNESLANYMCPLSCEGGEE